MFKPKFNEHKLKINLGLVVSRLKLIEKKKTDLALKARPEIADYVRIAKTDRARVRVEAIIREDYLVEAMELIEMYADLLQGRIGLMKQSKTLDPGLEKPISTLLWVAPRLMDYCGELKVVRDILAAYYGKKYAEACMKNEVDTICDRVMAKLDPSPPKRSLVECYLVEICKAAGVDFTPDPKAFEEDIVRENPVDTDFINFNNDNSDFNVGPPPGNMGGGGSGGGGGGGGHYALPVFSYAAHADPNQVNNPGNFQQPTPISDNFQQPQPAPAANFPGMATLPAYSPLDPNAEAQDKQAPPLPSKAPSPGKSSGYVEPGAPSSSASDLPAYNVIHDHGNASDQPPAPATYNPPPAMPNLPSVPTSFPSVPGGSSNQSSSDDVDFDDLSRRFENLRKKT